MKRVLVISYWVVSILLVAVVLTSLGYKFREAVFIGTMFLPGALAARYFFPKVDFKDRGKGIKEILFIVLGILVAEILFFLLAHFYISTLRENAPRNIYALPDIPEILTNPVFIALILTALATGSYFFEAWLDRKRPEKPGPITFTSERKSVTLPIEEILYVESNDSITTVVATGDRRFRNKTPISQWEATLSPDFIRIHRSYLVNKDAITQIDVDLLSIGDTQLPISRKYKEKVGALVR
jgi:hypothetical protein